MVGPRIPQCNCACAPPVNFEWGRTTRMVGPQSPHASLPGYTQPWIDISAHGTTWGFRTPGGYLNQSTFYMQPMRYEIGKTTSVLKLNSTLHVGQYQPNVAVSNRSPPLNGHLDSTTVWRVTVPCDVYCSKLYGSGMVVTLEAVELFKNGVSLGVQYQAYPPGSVANQEYVMNQQYGQFWGLRDKFPLDISPSVTVEADTWQWDLYIKVKNPPTPLIIKSPDVYAGDGSNWYAPKYAGFQSTTTVIGAASANAWKFVFGSNGPGGITELTMLPQPGWTHQVLGNTRIRMVKQVGNFGQPIPMQDSITLDWGREIPRVYFSSDALWNHPSAPLNNPLAGYGSAGMLYLPVDSSDYSSHFVTSDLNETYGFWSPAASTVFSNMRRQRINSAFYDYTTPGGYYDPGFPSSITVEPA